MPGFTGKYYYTADAKGRIIIPAPFREIISSNYNAKLYLANDAFDKCLHIYPQVEWNALEEKVRKLPSMDEAVKYFKRKVIASAQEVDLDKQGRILVPAAQREDAGLDSEIVIVGQINIIDLWDRKEWDLATDPALIDRKAFEEKLTGFGI
ncbi:MAG: division/cell wall cluster transcriptional repressor MraZ [Thermodesulfovibrionales bacterium]